MGAECLRCQRSRNLEKVARAMRHLAEQKSLPFAGFVLARTLAKTFATEIIASMSCRSNVRS